MLTTSEQMNNNQTADFPRTSTTHQRTKRVTMATINMFIRKNDNLFIKVKSKFDGILKSKQAHKVRTSQLICTETGRSISQNALRLRFDKRRDKAIKQNPAIAKDVKHFQFRDSRAKAASDKAESETMRDAQLQLGHSSMAMTEQYVRQRRGQKVSPTRQSKLAKNVYLRK